MMQRPRRRCEGTAMGAIILDLRPGLGIGPFTVGMPICEAFAQVEQQPTIYDVVHVKYLDEEPLKLDIVISFPDHGFHLRFHPWSQYWRRIFVYALIEIGACCDDVTHARPKDCSLYIGNLRNSEGAKKDRNSAHIDNHKE